MPASSFTELTQGEQKQLLEMVWQVIDDGLHGKGLQLPLPPKSDALCARRACFVTLYQHGKLRGCIGSLQAEDPLWLNACHNAYASAFEDRRFFPLTEDERTGLSLDISLLSPLKEVNNDGEQALLDMLTPDVDGLFIEGELRRAVFLPAVWSTLPDPVDFVEALKQKGGWPSGYWSDKLRLYLFTTEVIRS